MSPQGALALLMWMEVMAAGGEEEVAVGENVLI